MVMTVLGEIHESQLGVTSPHEHIFIDMKKCVDIPENAPEIFFFWCVFGNVALILFFHRIPA